MAGEIHALEQFFEVIGQSDQVELRQAVVVMDASRMHVPVDDAVAVKVGDRRGKLSKDTQ